MRQPPRVRFRPEIVQPADGRHAARKRRRNRGLSRVSETQLAVDKITVQLRLKRALDVSRRSIKRDPIPPARHGGHRQSVTLEPRAQLSDIGIACPEALCVLLRRKPTMIFRRAGSLLLN